MRACVYWFSIVSLIALAPASGSLAGASTAHSRSQATLVIFDDALGSGWADWSWNTTVSLNNSSPVHAGLRSISVRYDAAWAGLYLHALSAVSTGGYETLRFFIHGGSAGNQHLRIGRTTMEAMTTRSRR